MLSKVATSSSIHVLVRVREFRSPAFAGQGPRILAFAFASVGGLSDRALWSVKSYDTGGRLDRRDIIRRLKSRPFRQARFAPPGKRT